MSERINKRFCITGMLSMLRNDFIREVEKQGYMYHNTVNAKTDFLVIGEKPGGTKLDAARRLGIKEITEKEVMNVIHRNLVLAEILNQ
jgi:DNA ligase (NAD+)